VTIAGDQVGKSLVKGKNISGSTDGEEEMGLPKVVPFPVEDEVMSLGATLFTVTGALTRSPMADQLPDPLEQGRIKVAEEAVFRNADAARLGDLQPRRNIDAVAVYVSMSPSLTPIRNAIRFSSGCPDIGLRHSLLHGESAGDRLDHAGEFYEDPDRISYTPSAPERVRARLHGDCLSASIK
jgi:hypothetical protein